MPRERKRNLTDAVPGTGTLTKAVDLLNMIGQSEEPLRFADVLARSGLPRGTVHRLLMALVSHRLLRLEEKDQTYRLGMLVFELAHRVWDKIDVRGAAEPELERLRDLSGETVRMAILDGDEVIYIEQKESSQSIRLRFGVGGRDPVYCTSTGKAILAFMKPEKRHTLLSRLDLAPLTPKTITDRNALDMHLDLVRGRSYAIDDEEHETGVRSVSAPILDKGGEPIAAITIIGPAYRLSLDTAHALARDVITAARQSSGNFGASLITLATGARPNLTTSEGVTCALETNALLGEGPFWSTRDRCLYWTDILAPALHAFDVKTGKDTTIDVPEPIGSIVTRSSGGFVVGTPSGIKMYDLESGTYTDMVAPEPDLPHNRINDAKCDRVGRFWMGTVNLYAAPGQGSLYRLDTDGAIHRMDVGFTMSNGLGWSVDNRTLYFTDSTSRRIYAYDFDLSSGNIENRRVFIEVPEGSGLPAGLTVDSEGYVWSAHWDGWRVTRYAPDGSIDRIVPLPVPRPTSCLFGGDGLETLYVTSARIRMSAKQLEEAPLSGSIFAVDAGARGLPEPSYDG